MQKKNIQFLTQAAMIAAIYVVLTFVANAFGLANYAVQVRFSEALTILPIFTPAGIPGLFIGCLISNILTGCAIPDIIIRFPRHADRRVRHPCAEIQPFPGCTAAYCRQCNNRTFDIEICLWPGTALVFLFDSNRRRNYFLRRPRTFAGLRIK